MKRRINLLSVLVLCCVMTGCASPTPTLTPTTVPATSTPPLTATLVETGGPPVSTPTAVPATPTPVDLGPLPTPPPTAVPEEVNVEFVGVISSEPSGVTDYKGVFEPGLDVPLYSYMVLTLYITEIIQGQEYIQVGDTIILHDYHHLSPIFSSEQLQSEMIGMTFHIRGSYQADIGIMHWVEIIKDLGESVMYEPPPVVGRQGDITRIIVHFEPLTAINTWPGTLVNDFSGDVTLRLIDKNWAQVVTGVVHLGQVIHPAFVTVEILKKSP